MESHVNKKPKLGNFHNFSDDTIFEILIHLPGKSLCRFKCVSKNWLSIIQGQTFINRRRAKTPLLWQIQEDTKCLSIYSIDSSGFGTLDHQYTFEACSHIPMISNGLLCYHDYEDQLTLFNTFTKKAYPLPHLSLNGFKLGSDTLWNTEIGFDPLSKRYKLVRWVEFDGRAPIEFMVLTIDRDCSWKPVNNTLGLRSLPDCCISTGETVCWFDIGERHILSFSLAMEEFRVVEFPIGINMENSICHMLEFEGHLCLVEQPAYMSGRCLLDIVNLWILMDMHENRWFKLMENVSLPLEGTGLDESYSGYAEPDDTMDLSVISSNGDILVIANDDEDPYIFSYSLLNQQIQRIEVVETVFLRMSRGSKHEVGRVNPEKFLPRGFRRRARAKGPKEP